jgi:hypothetical protein
LRVVDLGTRFGLSLSPEGDGLVRVHQGEVDVHHGQTRRHLGQGDALAFDRTGTLTEARLPESPLPSESDLRGRIALLQSRRALSWAESFNRLSQDPAALLAYPFTPASTADRQVANQARGANEKSALVLVGADWAEGRWPGKSAVEFGGRGDRLRLRVDGYHTQLTLLCWTRVDSLENDYNGLLMPEGYRAGSIQWMLRRDGHLRFSMANGLASTGTPEGWDRVISAPAIASTDLGRWVFLATTYDSASGQVVHYRDGVATGSGRLERPLPAHLGSMGVGNWAGGSIPSPADETPKPRSFFRNLTGRIDELTVLSRALGTEEIQAHYLAGRS